MQGLKYQGLPAPILTVLCGWWGALGTGLVCNIFVVSTAEMGGLTYSILNADMGYFHPHIH